MVFNRLDISDKKLIELYKGLLYPRLIEEKMLKLLRQGKITKWFSGIGQEAISVGAISALQTDEFVLPLIRNLGVFTGRKIPLQKLFLQFQGKKNGFTKGRDRSFHFGSIEHSIVGMISHLGPQLAVADGIALYNKINKEKKATIVFSGDGGTSEGDFHEGVNLAAVWDLPVIFIIENNGYGLSTPSNEQFKCKSIADKGPGYGIESISIDGNNILEVYSTIKHYAELIREEPRPILIEARTFRMRGHEEASGTKYVPKQLFEEWKTKDPIANFEQYLINEKLLNENSIQEIRKEIDIEINEAWDASEDEPQIIPNLKEELDDVYKIHKPEIVYPISELKSEKRFINSITDALSMAMEKYPELVLMGQDIAEYGGAFKVTDGFVNQYGKARVRNTPLCESAILGAAMGYSIKGGKAVVEMQFADFVTSGFNQIVNN
ncbi:MAG: thiamine pyrophosphate-dependent enzyme, partial [Ignavibacteriaceae bacterium]|nr:thiamine pyrophosphate-dependent enzyme [Ignavibacteriaceae bacterium]